MTKWLRGLPQEWRKTLAATNLVIGVDEVGYGAWAGPITAAAFVSPVWWEPDWIKDSKRYKNPVARERARDDLPPFVQYAIQHVPAEVVDSLGYVRAWELAVLNALQRMPEGLPVIIDGQVKPSMDREVFCMAKADSTVPAVSAASIVAKIERDGLMAIYHRVYPEYEFAQHSGYGTKLHEDRIAKYGLCPIHRRRIRRFHGEHQICK